MKKSTHQILRFIIRLVLNIIARVEISGFEKVPATGGYIIASNHIGRLDAAIAYYILDRPDIIMVVAEKYEKVAFFRWLTRLVNGMFIDRYNADIHAIRETLRRIRKGGIFAITPEGTRSKSGNLLAAKPGAAYLAWKAGVPVLPVALTGTEDAVVVERLKHFKRLQIKAVAGEFFTLPMEVKGAQREAIMQANTDEIMCRIAALLPPDRRGAYSNHPRLQALLEGLPARDENLSLEAGREIPLQSNQNYPAAVHPPVYFILSQGISLRGVPGTGQHSLSALFGLPGGCPAAFRLVLRFVPDRSLVGLGEALVGKNTDRCASPSPPRAPAGIKVLRDTRLYLRPFRSAGLCLRRPAGRPG